MSVALYPGSFDPFTNGHLNILNHASNIFDKVYVMLILNPNKKRLTSVVEMENVIKSIIYNKYTNVEVVSASSSLTYKEAHRLNCDYIVRGIRNNGLDYPYEENLAEFNQKVGNINTIFIRADLNKFVSSTMIKTLLLNGESISSYVPEEVNNYLKEHRI
jgi:pantetheine-phosphate adenylyltransferase